MNMHNLVLQCTSTTRRLGEYEYHTLVVQCTTRRFGEYIDMYNLVVQFTTRRYG